MVDKYDTIVDMEIKEEMHEIDDHETATKKADNDDEYEDVKYLGDHRDEEVLMLKSKRGHAKLCLRGYCYYRSKSSSCSNYWTCDDVRSSPDGKSISYPIIISRLKYLILSGHRCHATVTTFKKDNRLRFVNGRHIHEPDPQHVRYIMAKNEMKDLMNTKLDEKPEAAYYEIMGQLQEKYSDVIDDLPTKKSFQLMLRRMKLEQNPSARQVKDLRHETESYRDDKFLILSSRRSANSVLFIRNHLYQRNKSTEDRHFWRCLFQKHRDGSGELCRASISTTSDNKKLVKVRPYHNHPGYMKKALNYIAYEKVLQLARVNPDETAESIVDKFIESHVDVELPPKSLMMGKVHNSKQNNKKMETNQAVLDFDLRTLASAHDQIFNEQLVEDSDDEQSEAEINPKFFDHQNKCRSCFGAFEPNSTKVIIKQQQMRMFHTLTGIELRMDSNFSKYLCTGCDAELKRLAKFRENIGGLQKEFYEFAESEQGCVVMKREIVDDIEHVNMDDPLSVSTANDFFKEELESEEEDDNKSEIEPDASIRECYVKLDRIDVSNYPQYSEEVDCDIEDDDDDDSEYKPKCKTRKVKVAQKSREPKKIARSYTSRPKNVILTCDLCDKKFDEIPKVIAHMKVHRFDYTCTTCNLNFKTLARYEKHLRVIHPDKQPDIPCTECEQKFFSESSLKSHMERIHWSSIPCVDKNCTMKFFRVSQMRFHYDNVHDKNKKNVSFVEFFF